MNELDYIVIIFLLISVLIGLFRGFIKEILKLINVIAAVSGALYFKSYLTGILNIIQSEFIKEIIAMGVLWIGIFIFGNFVICLIYKLMNIQGIIKIIDKSLGIIYGLSRCLFICLIIVVLMEKSQYLVNENFWQKSLCVTEVKKISVLLEKSLPDPWKNKVNEFIDINLNNNNNNNNNKKL